ncbi:MAG: prepilin-type N-terminal cleavage/methylation domain-containing protein [Planctomycetaceae bacterium]|nr:prepilin-type N-terminal cleavage/methylation domain-containing protein [Planctomycetaceae bacterium]
MSGLRPRVSFAWRRQPAGFARRSGFTLVEMLVAVGLTVLMMTMVVTVFGLVMDSIRDSRGAIEVNDRLRATKNRLQYDLEGVTAPMAPPLNPAMDRGYFEYIEGPIGPVVSYLDAAGSDNPDAPYDSTSGDRDDILMFTVVSKDEPFVGRFPNPTVTGHSIVQSQVAEVVWFLRGTTLYRRVLLVYSPSNGLDLPNMAALAGQNLYQHCDISLRCEGDPGSPPDFSKVRLVPNTLGDLTKRECRFAHQPFAWPYDARFWGNLSLPTLEECSAVGGGFNSPLDYASSTPVQSKADPSRSDANPRSLYAPAVGANGQPFNILDAPSAWSDYHSQRLDLRYDPNFPYRYDPWRTPHPAAEQDHTTGQIVPDGFATRVGEDVILTDVLSFDVKVWDPGAPILDADPANPGNGVILPSDPPSLPPGGTNLHPPAIVTALQAGNLRAVGFGAYVDLNYLCRLGPNSSTVPGYDKTAIRNAINPALPLSELPDPQFHHAGDVRSGLWGTFPAQTLPADVDDLFRSLRASVYDTYSTHYETDGINQSNVPWNPTPNANADAGTNGLDDNASGVNGAVDESSAWPDVTSGEKETAPPYPHPIRGIQIKIRVFEPGTRQVREVTLEHEFVSQ